MVRHADLLTVLAHLALQDSRGEAWCSTAQLGDSAVTATARALLTRVCTGFALHAQE
jgi:hypothetical protein